MGSDIIVTERAGFLKPITIPRVYEWRITRLRMGLLIRFWISQDIIPDPQEAKRIADEAVNHSTLSTMQEYAERIMEYSLAFNSVEVCDENGDGVCVHRDWP